MDTGLSGSGFVWILAMEFVDEVKRVLQIFRGFP